MAVLASVVVVTAVLGVAVLVAPAPAAAEEPAVPEPAAADSVASDPAISYLSYGQKIYPLYPAGLDTIPDLPSPLVTDDGEEIVMAFRDGEEGCFLFLVTLENGDPLDYRRNQWGKGRQLKVNRSDFSALGRTGFHSDAELSFLKTITDRPVEEITLAARPGGASRAGFIAEDEEIVTVLRADNRLARRLDLKHRELARPLFHMWNIIQQHEEQWRVHDNPQQGMDAFRYGDRVLRLNWGHGHGWQTSIFDDEILGMFQIDLRLELTAEEEAYLNEAYGRMGDEEYEEIVEMLTHLHTGEMVPYYIMRYGFYEGHTSYRADPLVIAFMFGLRSLEELDLLFGGQLYRALITHFGR